MKFRNEPLSDFSIPETRRAMEHALDDVRHQLGKTYSLIIAGKPVTSRQRFNSINPASPEQVVGIVQEADPSQALRALDAAERSFASWSRVPGVERASLLRRMAAILRRKKFHFSAWLVFEVGKSWAEADADVAEAIDFLDYYAELSEVPPPVLTPVPGERNEYRYLPVGPVLVIPPWNFPLAILVGMTVAAVVTGNTVVLKPSSQSPVIAAQFMALAEEAGIPPGVINFVTGSGGRIGDLLVKDPRTRMIAFTGSKSVGLHINALAAQSSAKTRWIKRIIAEMGGKNAIVVDASADLESAAQGALASAFGYQGQKCSACSRLYVHRDLYDDFSQLVLSKIKSIRQGSPDVLENFMGPVISAGAEKGILQWMRLAKREGRLLAGGSKMKGEKGYFLVPTLVDKLPLKSRLWKEEVFGPLLAMTSIDSVDQGIALANSTDYGLTGSIYSRDEAHLRQARDEFFCGNLYLNRKSTGAWVGGHPFGGFNLSGTDSKAGGPDYLLLFQQAKAISQRL